MSSTSLVTDGYICYPGQAVAVQAPASLNTPELVATLEVRPKIRRATSPPADAGDPVPSVVSVQELRPTTSGRVTPEVTTTPPPTTRTAQELKPKITSVEEED